MQQPLFKSTGGKDEQKKLETAALQAIEVLKKNLEVYTEKFPVQIQKIRYILYLKTLNGQPDFAQELIGWLMS